MTADITLRGPGDVIAVLPYQLGYHPRDSVVVVTLHDRQVGLVARADLPPDDHVSEVLAALMGPLLREGAGSVIVVGFEDDTDASLPLLLALVEALERAGVVVADVAVVRDGRRYSPICSDPCCPPEGIALPHPADVPGVVEMVGMGRAPLSSRDCVEGLVAPEPWRCVGVAAAVDSRDRMPRRRRRAVAAWRAVLAEGERGTRPPDRRVVADLALGLADVPWRDALIAWLAPGVLPVDELDPKVLALMRETLPTWAAMGASGTVHRGGRVALAAERDELLTRLLALCRSVPDECPVEAAAVCAVAAHVAWVGGDGAIARAAVERAVRLAPGYRLAELLERLIDNGIRLPRGAVGAGRAGTSARAEQPQRAERSTGVGPTGTVRAEQTQGATGSSGAERVARRDGGPGTERRAGTDAGSGTERVARRDGGPGTERRARTDAGPGTERRAGTDAGPGTERALGIDRTGRALPPRTERPGANERLERLDEAG